ncbi:DNA polymerase I [Solirubrobacter sp. CPCC 204708]|uniref:DNA-directed DNA polymerase n=1 Tax=Solirubrobacter deserti TaxID=2282478 RepID=A0ABT4RVF8_9ACTN|nr:DNA polymerase I [Solirubrobacter deserti]MBE2316317.1 DNA polymerase I [Solirubrobacter deserti]MDA0142445.1 DNA polymerase I [Solirubrobacter deserti]
MAGSNGDTQRELFLIDGNSLAYRAFFALPESIATSDGRPTNAIFGFASMLVKILTDYGQVPTVVVWDAGMSGRKEISADYKAQRSKKPDLLSLQWPHLRPLVEAFGYRNVSVEGYEADDVIAALTEQAKERGVPVMVVTGDRDAYQLVDDGVRIMSTSRGVTDTKVYDREAVIERYGIAPELIPDFIGLKGDTSDNIPGVPGIGDKTAADLLQKFGDLEGVLSSIDQITGAKRKQNLIEHADNARMSKLLATMVRDVPVDIDLEAEFTREPDRANLRAVFRDWELRDPLRRLEEALEAAELEAIPRPEDVEKIQVKTGPARNPSDITRLKGEYLAVALQPPEIPEGELLPREPRWRFAAYAGGNIALSGEVDDPKVLVEAVGDRAVIAHDAKALTEIPRNLVFDTAIAGYLLDPARRGYPLDELAEERAIAAEAGDELATTAVLIHELANRQRPQIVERGLQELLDTVELPLVKVLRETEKAGIKLDTKQLEIVATRIKAEVAELEREIWELAGEEFILGSPQQLQQILFEKLGLSRKRRGKTGYSTDNRVLEAIKDEHEIVPKIIKYRELSKLAQTYLDALPNWIGEDGRLHTTFEQTTAATGRLSSINPNLQNIPIRTETGREIRACFIPEPGNVLLSADYSQVELRVLAQIANEQVLRDIFLRGEDVHTETASAVFELPAEQLDVGMRSKAKMVNYGIVYGLSAYGLADRLKIPQEEAQEFIDRYLERFPAVAQFMKDAVEQASEHGYVSTLIGRRRQIPELRARNWQVRKLGERLAVNTVIQGTAADIIKIAMVRCYDALEAAGLKTRCILQIHDELLFEGPPDEMEQATAIVTREMVGAIEMDPPLEVDAGVGENWLKAK